MTTDLSPENIRRLALALTPYRPYLRGAPRSLPFGWDAATIQRGLWEIGLARLSGGSYDELLPHSVTRQIYAIDCRLLGLEALTQTKRAAGRPRDLAAT